MRYLIALLCLCSIAQAQNIVNYPQTTAVTQSAGDNSNKLATDAFVTTAVNNAIAGVNPAIAVSAATTTAANTSGCTYANGVAGIGATLTCEVNTVKVIDGFTFNSITQSLLVKNDTQSPSGAFNGIYNLTAVQTGITGAIFTRRLDYDTPSDINNTGAIPVIGGTVNAVTSWLLTSQVTTIGTDPLTYVQFSVNPTTVITSSTAAGGDLAGTYPNPTIKSSVGLTGTPTATTSAVGDNSTTIATNAFVAAATAGINPAVEVDVATTTAGNTSGLTYANGTAGVGATLTGSINTAITIDGFTFTATGQRLLVKDDTQSPSGARNGVYSLTTLQAGGVAPIFTRATDYNTPANINSTGVIPVVSGTANTGTFWYLTSNVVTIGTTPITYLQFTSNTTATIATNSQVWAGTRNKYIDAHVNQTALGVTALAISTATFTVNLTLGLNFSVTLVHASCPCTMANPTNTYAGASGFIELIQSATGSDTITTWGSNWKFSGGTKPTLSTAANAKDVVPYFCDATNFCMIGAIQTAFQ